MRSNPLALNIRMRDGGQDDVMLPTGITPPFEMVEAQFALQFLALLLDGPPLMGQGHHRPFCERGKGRRRPANWRSV